MAERIEEMQTKSAPDSFGIIGENIRTQDNRITSDPMFCVYQKREIAVDADYDHDRIVWLTKMAMKPINAIVVVSSYFMKTFESHQKMAARCCERY